MPPKVKILRDRKYLDSFNGAVCYACGTCDGTIVPAHIRHGFSGGMGLKPDDNLALPLCFKCHAHQHDVGELAFWAGKYPSDLRLPLIQVLKDKARRRWEIWKLQQKD